MAVSIHPHALARMAERGATRLEVTSTIEEGERFPAKFGRTGFRRNFPYGREWRGKVYGTKQVVAYAVQEHSDWLVITVMTKYY